ncbi:MAG: hypothetical protein P1V97_34825 [Planctomycetota bacterium]|nr:hypothetical protein [Planctomycetota bacterium]
MNESSEMAMPKTERKFDSPWEEIEYLYQKASYWLLFRNQRYRSQVFFERMKKLVQVNDPLGKTLCGADALALIADFEGSIQDEMDARKHAMDVLVEMLRNGPECRDHDWSDVTDALVLQASLHADIEDHERTYELLCEAEQNCIAQGLSADYETWEKELLPKSYWRAQ